MMAISMASIAEVLTIALGHHESGRFSESAALCRRILEASPDEVGARRILAASLAGEADAALDRGDAAAAIGPYREARDLVPESVGIHFNLAIAERDTGRLREARDGFAAAARLCPDLGRAYLELGFVETRLGRPERAADHLRRGLALDPIEADALYTLGTLTDARREPKTRLALLLRAAVVRPDHAAAHAAAAIVQQSTGRRAEAIAGYRRAIVSRPALPEALTNLCIALTETGALFEAARAGERAVTSSPDSAEALLALGNALKASRIHVGALALYRASLKRRPDFSAAHCNLGVTLSVAGYSVEAFPHLRRAIALGPGERTQYANIGLVLRDMGRVDEALTAYRRALAIDPDWVETHSDMIFTMDMLPGVTTADLQAARRVFNERHCVPLRGARKPLHNDRDPERRLRIGLVSADFRMNSAAFAFGPVMREMDRDAFEIFCYSGVVVEDEMTHRLRPLASRWRSTVGMDDETLAELIRADGIDVLVDMSGHSAGNRQRVFARRPAPVQLTAWTHPHGIGLETMDYVFSDPVTIPEGERHHFREEIWHLPLCIPFEPPTETPPVTRPPVLNSGRVTFGCLNRLSKVTPPVIALWARILRECPEGDLLLKDKALNDPLERERVAARFAEHGIAANRLRFLGGSGQLEHLATNAQIDIGLDPFPLNGGITTMESLWMGVPMVALLGSATPSRVSAAIDISLGLDDWVAKDTDEYVAIAVAKARDLPALVALRATMRDRFLESPAGNIVLYTREVERAYREMWRRWCAAAPDARSPDTRPASSSGSS